MPNIYLRLPSLVATYIRHSQKVWLEANEPVRFSRFERGSYILENYLNVDARITARADRISPCFTQVEWNNMMRGFPPNGGHKLINRDSNVYLDYCEISKLTGATLSEKNNDYQYLCIEIPQMVFRDGRMYKTNASWKLNRVGETEMAKYLRSEFLRGMYQWRYEWYRYLYNNWENPLLERRDVDMWNRFLLHFDLPVDNEKEWESFKKSCQRHAGGEDTKALREALPAYFEDIERPDTHDKKLFINEKPIVN